MVSKMSIQFVVVLACFSVEQWCRNVLPRAMVFKMCFMKNISNECAVGELGLHDNLSLFQTMKLCRDNH